MSWLNYMLVLLKWLVKPNYIRLGWSFGECVFTKFQKDWHGIRLSIFQEFFLDGHFFARQKFANDFTRLFNEVADLFCLIFIVSLIRKNFLYLYCRHSPSPFGCDQLAAFQVSRLVCWLVFYNKFLHKRNYSRVVVF